MILAGTEYGILTHLRELTMREELHRETRHALLQGGGVPMFGCGPLGVLLSKVLSSGGMADLVTKART